MLAALIDVVALTAVFAAAVRVAGWWAIPAFAFVWAWRVGPARAPAARSAVAACLAVGGWLVFDAVRGPLANLAHTVGAILHAPAAVPIVVTLALPMALAWSAAALAVEATYRGRSSSASSGAISEPT